MLGGVATIVYTDGACSGNPGPGGWAWAVPDGAWARGFDPDTTNQRMELMAALKAVEMLDGELDIVSDSTYFVNCFRDGWWKGWQKRGWVNSKKEPVKNRDLWEPLIAAHQAGRFGVPRWVKGHSGDRMNDIVDRLAVASAQGRDAASGDAAPEASELGPADDPRPGRRGGVGAEAGATSSSPASSSASSSGRLADLDAAERRAERRRRDGRIPEGTLLVVGGQRSLPDDPTQRRILRRRLGQMVAGYAEMHPDLQVLTGLRPGAEAFGGEVAAEAGVAWTAVLPWPEPQRSLAAVDRQRFDAQLAESPATIVLEKKTPDDRPGRAAALTRRDAWLAGAADVALLLWDGTEPTVKDLVRRFESALGDDLVLLWPDA